MELITLGELYHIMMMITGLWVMVFSVIYLIAFTRKNKHCHYPYKRKKK